MPEVFTIGHSTHSIDQFIGLLEDRGITAIADVRSSPWSRFNPQFNRDVLRRSLKDTHVDYRFFGKQLGGRPQGPSLFRGSTADYEAMARTTDFLEGLDLVVSGAAKHRLALMCSEHEPLDCHRCLLVGRALVERGVDVSHVLGNGTTCTHSQVEDKLLALSGHDAEDFFLPRSERLDSAYRDRSLKVAYTEQQFETDDPGHRELRYG